MSFQKQRKRFIKNNIKYIGKIELDFLKEYNITEVIKNCGKLKNKYISYCDETAIIEGIDQFYDDDWFTFYNDKIDHLNYEILKELTIKLRLFKHILQIDILYDKTKIENNLYECIKKRILYKHQCILLKNRDKGHDAEILHQLFNFLKLKELLILFKNIENRYNIMKEEREKQRKELEKQRKELEKQHKEEEEICNEFEKVYYGNSSGTSDSFEPVIPKRNKKRKRYFKH